MAVTRRSPGTGSPSPLTPPPRPAAILAGRAQWCCDIIRRRRYVIGRRPVVTEAMEAAVPAPDPREEAEEWRRRLLRSVTRLQACVRGFLLRRRLRSVRAEYEEVVREIEGDLSELQWRGLYLPRPIFVPEPMKGKCSAMQEPVSSDKDGTEKRQQELDVSKPERDWGCSTSVKPPAQLQSKKELSSEGECDVASPPNLGAVAGKSSAKRCSAPAQSKEWQNTSSISSVWDSADLEPGSLKACLEIPLVDVKELPRTRSGLQSFRNHLIMELLWLQQAINSRKNYLKLKQRLESPGS
ncbi:IQ domain-containing protein C-like isoform X2 [Numida meleagris]|uniref:IQ domain-containing protein C-like isoform X2 n=1 Tax=Numida meleagris TaxID=8996 RepID=UPI000B3DE77B|nr:IQ domain-containing protein C-like isoform X2 [Numida meleagris]